MLKPAHLGRYRDLGLLLTRYGLKDFKLDLKSDALLAQVDSAGEEKPLEPDVQARAKAFTAALSEMGPTYVKFGQILSTRPDIVPPEYICELEELQDQVEPFSYAEVEAIVEKELNAKVSKAFGSFEQAPLAAASLGQVHRATLREGQEIVVKVQRPNIRETIEQDLDVFAEIAVFLESHSAVAQKMSLTETVKEMRRTILTELNYTQEASVMENFRKSLAEYPEIVIPEVIHDYSTPRLLTTEYISGKKVSKLSPLELIDHDYAPLATVLTRAYLKQICVDGFWHSDPHPGNVFLRDGQLVLLDFGMVSRISREFQDQVIKLLLSVTENRGRDVAEVCMKVGSIQEGFDRNKFIKEISQLVTTYHDANLRDTNTGQLIFGVIGVATANEIQVPSELAMMAKTLLHLDGITRKLDPEFNPRETIRDYAESLVAKKVAQSFNPRNYYTSLMDLNELLIELPRRSRELLDQATTGRITLNIALTQADHFLKGIQAVANRITTGLVVAALIIGSALIMRIPTTFTIFGYPTLAILGFLAASAIGFYMVINALLQDRQDRAKAKPQILN
ncbi:MAG TPA: AarF/ABC1/UbiB kinase family protein [Thermoanaerobaculia bacterium]|nr:AarF/ABC1/UbiB kinase family protein [Thermoanaerobaculia bacterium]